MDRVLKQTNVKENKMGNAPIGGLIFRLSVPLMVSMLVQSLYNIVDGIFVSRISEDALTATSLAYPAQMLMLAVAVGTGVGVNSLLSRKLGQKDFEAANQAATEGLVLALISSLVFMIGGTALCGSFIRAFTDNRRIADLGIRYLRICLVLCPGIFLATTGERLLQATGNTFWSMIAQLAGAVTNIILDPIIIFGWFGVPEMGIQGAAVATVIGQWVAAAAALGLNHKMNHEVHFKVKGYRPDLLLIGEVYRVGIPSMLMQTMGSLMMAGMNAILSDFSSVAVAAFGVYYKLWTFVYMPVSGLAQGLLPIIGYNYGAKNGTRVKKAFQLTVLSAVGIMAAGALLFSLIPQQLLGLYAAGTELMAVGIPLIRIMSATFPAAAISITIGFACSGLGNGMVSMLSTCIRQLVLLVPLAGLMAVRYGLDYAWYAAWISETAAVLFSIRCFYVEYQKKIRPIL
ncbi:MAG: MATE family efflux transporter [Clostridium sp.]|nr:MATE family efflux transporter [Clostridium sp.]